MSKYTTGEIAKLCGVTVRTVQYYDTRNILVPSELSEGGRRLYSDGDLKRMRIICFLREAGIPISSIESLLNDEHPENVIQILLEEQEKVLRKELSERQKKMNMIEDIRRWLKDVGQFSVESIGDIATIMTNKQKLRKIHLTMLLTGIPMGILQWGSIIMWTATGIWWPFILWVIVAVPWAIWVSKYYFRNVAYICPECHKVFKPRFKEAFWANHTPTLRKLTCSCCGHKGWCVETCAEEVEQNV
ncbi:MAG: MerR family transcriptional regulator [Roseburia sp.]|nr:MerR family transcriptional regulator [Roseburia sp.]MCM1279127.1 MerR family transcriptional regulator [Robinsoniella sp.]